MTICFWFVPAESEANFSQSDITNRFNEKNLRCKFHMFEGVEIIQLQYLNVWTSQGFATLCKKDWAQRSRHSAAPAKTDGGRAGPSGGIKTHSNIRIFSYLELFSTKKT